MNNDKMIQYVKRWQKLERERKSYEYGLCMFCRDLRKEVSSDAQFVKWCCDELGLPPPTAAGLLTRVAISRLASDESDFDRLGGFKGLRYVVENLPDRRQQVEAVEAARASGKTAMSIVIERRKAAEKSESDDAIDSIDPRLDAVALARFIVKSVDAGKIPADVMTRVKRYTRISPVQAQVKAIKAAA